MSTTISIRYGEWDINSTEVKKYDKMTFFLYL